MIAEGKKVVSQALAHPISLPILEKLFISEINSINQKFAFEGRILYRYGTYDLKLHSNDSRNEYFRKYLKCDLADQQQGYGTISLVVTSEFIPNVEKLIVIDICIRVERGVVVPRVPSDGGTSDYSLQLDTVSSVVKAEPFSTQVVFIRELSIQAFLQKVAVFPAYRTTIAVIIIQVDSVQKSEGGMFEQLTIVDGPTALDRVTVS